MSGSVICAQSGIAARNHLIAALRQAIEAQHLSQSAAARLIGTDQPTLSKILSGATTAVTIERLIGWLDRLGHRVDIAIVPLAPVPRASAAHAHRARGHG